MKKFNTKKTIILTSIATTAIVSPIALATTLNNNQEQNQQPIINNNYSSTRQGTSQRDLDLSNLIQLQNNQDQLLRNIGGKYDETRLEFFSCFSNQIYLQNNIQKINVKEYSKRNIIEATPYSRCVYCGNWNLHHSTSCPEYNKPSVKPHEHTLIAHHPKISLNKQIDNQLKNKFSEKQSIENYGFPILKYSYQYSSQKVCSNGLNCTENMTSVYSTSSYWYSAIDGIIKSTDIKTQLLNKGLPIVLKNKLLLPSNDSKKITTTFRGDKSNEVSEAWGSFSVDYTINLSNENHQSNSLSLNKDINYAISFKNQNINWDKFFVLKAQNIDDNGSVYKTRPSIELGLNLPLVNAINWYGQLPTKFNEMRNKILDVQLNLSKASYDIFTEVFGSKNGFYKFMNSYLKLMASFIYNETNYENIMTFLNDLNSSNPSNEVLSAVKEIIKIVSSDSTTQKFVEYNGIQIPVPNSIDPNAENQKHQIMLLLNNLHIKSYNFIFGNNDNNSLFDVDGFKNLETINEFNAYSDVILPVILSQNINARIVDNTGIERTYTLYDGNNHQFIKNAFQPTGVMGDFDSPYSTIKIKEMWIGEELTQRYLGTNVRIDNQEQYNSMVYNSKEYATKTINGKVYSAKSNNGFNDPIYMQSTPNGIEIKYRFIADPKPIDETAWWEVKGQNEISPFILMPDEAWEGIPNATTTPDSPLKDIIRAWEVQELVARTIARPFVMKKSITGADLAAAKAKYIYDPLWPQLFSKESIRNIFLTDDFANKYNEKSNKPWWTWRFADLIKTQDDYENKVKGAVPVVNNNNYQYQWFRNFVGNKNLENKTMQDFFPKCDEGRFFAIGSYKPAIDSTQIRLTEEAGFYYAGEQRDAWHQITNFNYVVELEVKNKTYYTDLDTFSFSNLKNYKGQAISYFKYKDMMENLDDSLFKNKFKIQSRRYKEGQITPPEFKYIPFNSNNPLIQNGYGKLEINYQKSIPVINQIGNDVVYEQLPFDMNKLVGLENFYNRYKNEIVSLDEYNQLNEIQRESKILINTQDNKIIIGGRIFSKYQDFEINFIDLTEAFNNQKPQNTVYGFNQKDRSYLTLDQFTQQWNSLTQEELIQMFIKPEYVQFYNELVEPAKLKMYVKVENNNLIVGYTFTNTSGKFGDVILAQYDLTCINAVHTNIQEFGFKYGYIPEEDADWTVYWLKDQLKDVNKLVNYFNFDNEFDRENFIKGIKSINIIDKDQNTKNQFYIELSLNENYVTYNEYTSLLFLVTPREIKKVSIGNGNLELKNFNSELKDKLKNVIDDNNKILDVLNSLSLNQKIALFGSAEKLVKLNHNQRAILVGDQNEDGIINSDGSITPYQEIKDVVFRFDNGNLVVDVQLGSDNYALDAKTNLVVDDFVHNLKIDLGLIDPFKDTMKNWMIGGFSALGALLLAIGGWIFWRRHRQKQKLVNAIDNNQQVLTSEDLFSDDNKEEISSEENTNSDENLENNL